MPALNLFEKCSRDEAVDEALLCALTEDRRRVLERYLRLALKSISGAGILDPRIARFVEMYDRDDVNRCLGVCQPAGLAARLERGLGAVDPDQRVIENA